MSLNSPRIISLLPAATEIIAALGLVEHLVGRSHECDEPTSVQDLPALTAPRINASGSSLDIHQQVEHMQDSLFVLDVEQLVDLKPDFILTQATCDVCAVSESDVRKAVADNQHTHILTLSPTTLNDVFADILSVGQAVDKEDRARDVVSHLKKRCDTIPSRLKDITTTPRVAVIEWLDPPMAAGNWVPEMVALAGGQDIFGNGGSHSHWITWEDIVNANPDIVVLTPCGFELNRVIEEANTPSIHQHLHQIPAVREGRAWAVDGHHLFNRPGPRLVDSLEILAEILHPQIFQCALTNQFVRPLT